MVLAKKYLEELGKGTIVYDVKCSDDLAKLILKYGDLNIIFREYAIKRISKNNSLQHILDLIIQFHSSKLIPDDFKKYLLNFFDKTLFMKPTIIKKATGCDNRI